MKLNELKRRRIPESKTGVLRCVLHVGVAAHTAGERLDSWSREQTL